MLYIISICIISALALAGMFAFIRDTRKFFYQKIPLCITLHSRDLGNEAEYYIRSLFVYYPDLNIAVLDDGGNSETSAILARLSNRCPSLFVTDV